MSEFDLLDQIHRLLASERLVARYTPTISRYRRPGRSLEQTELTKPIWSFRECTDRFGSGTKLKNVEYRRSHRIVMVKFLNAFRKGNNVGPEASI